MQSLLQQSVARAGSFCTSTYVRIRRKGQVNEREHSAIVSPLHWIPEFVRLSHRRVRSQARMLGLALLVGVVAGLGAIVFYCSCQIVVHFALDWGAGYRAGEPKGEAMLFTPTTRPFLPWILLVVPTVGGLLSGFLVYSVAPEAEGHGTDSVIDAYHHRQGRIAARVPLVKIVASALTIGSGGSGGREGPIAQIGAGFGSLLGGVLRLRAADRRVLMAAGMGAGVAAIFRAPLAGALFAAEVLYSSPDFESEVIMPAALASITAYCTFGAVFGWSPLFEIPADTLAQLTFTHVWELASYLLLALCMVVLAMIYTRMFYASTHLFHRVALPRHFRPAIGAFCTGAVGLALFFAFQQNQSALAVLSFGYGILQDVMTLSVAEEADLSLATLLLAVAFGKILTTSLTIGSGGSGGVFGPSMVIGGCAGGALGIAIHHFAPALAPHPAAFVIVGMAGFFSAAAKTPFSTLVIVGEMTGNYNLLLPTLWVTTIAFLLSDEQSIYSSQVFSRSRSPAHKGDYVRDVLAGMSVEKYMRELRGDLFIRPVDAVEDIALRLSSTTFSTLPVVDSDHRFLGVVTIDEVHLASRSHHSISFLMAADLMRDDITPLCLTESLDRALELFVESELLALPVVRSSTDRTVIGIVQRTDIASTYLLHVQGGQYVTNG